jgi:hypothetical protein
MLQSGETRRHEQLEHLAQVHALSRAVSSAISAIETNDLQQFEIHLAAQESICNRLSGSKWMLPSTATGAVDGGNLDAHLLQEIRQAYVVLAQLNRVYAALLRRACRSLELMAAIYRGHEQGYGRGPAPFSQRRAWSCEV